eukprot:XP_020407920.1 zinc finger BED domain-containing protein RICESLEEPER 2-like [Zea mays]
MEEENTPLPASLGSRSRTRTKQLTKKPPISMQKMPAATTSSASGNRSNVSISVEPTTNSREEEDKEEDNSLDMEDDFSLSLSSEDGGSQGEDEVQVAQVHNAKRGVKRAKGDVPLSPSKCKLNRHLDKCTAYQNKLPNAKSKVAQAMKVLVERLKNECMKVYESEKDLLKKTLREAESISLTTDLWTSNQNVQYISLVAHYIDVNWELQCRVLNFVELDPSHTGVVIAQAIFECLVEWKIEDKVITITLDNAINNDVAITNLTSKLLARRNTQFDPLYFHVRCASHIVNLAVNDGLQPIDDLISNLRETVKYFKRSPSRMYKFMDVCKEYVVKVGKGLSLDVKTRWSSTYRMLDTCIDYRAAFGYYVEKDHNNMWEPSQSQWDMYEKIRPILGTMAGATTAFSGSVYPTANVFYPYIVKVKIALIGAKNSGDPYLWSMAAAMLEKFDKYWEKRNNIMVIATILDPRFKMRYIKWCFGQIYDSIRCEKEFDEINKELEGLFKKYELLYRQKMGDSNQNTQTTSSSMGTNSSLAAVVPDEFQNYLESSATEGSKSELLIYLDEPNVPTSDKNFSLLPYWQQHAHRFPVVSSMAKRFLAVPTSSVSSESTFSTGGRVVDDYRSSLKLSTVQALVCASSWIRGSQHEKTAPILVEGDDGDIEFVEFPKGVVASN